jgi:hypothetical protein
MEVNDDFLILQTELFDGDVCSVSPRTTVISVKGDLGSVAVSSCHVDVFSEDRYASQG